VKPILPEKLVDKGLQDGVCRDDIPTTREVAVVKIVDKVERKSRNADRLTRLCNLMVKICFVMSRCISNDLVEAFYKMTMGPSSTQMAPNYSMIYVTILTLFALLLLY
jgi:hypothetical protein